MGEVTAVERESKTKKLLCHVVYTDGDMEDMHLSELKKYLIDPIPSNDDQDREVWKQGWGEEKGKTPAPFEKDYFRRSPCRLTCAKRFHPSMYPGFGHDSHLYHLKRISDRNYAMRAFCISDDPAKVGAKYCTFARERVAEKCVCWFAQTGLANHYDDTSIVDTVHADLVDPTKQGKCLLTSTSLDDATHEKTECIFMNLFASACPRTGFRGHPEVVAKCIRKASDTLVCFSIVESTLTKDILLALATCKRLSGLLIDDCALEGVSPQDADEALALVLKTFHRMRWLHVGGKRSTIFGESCWKVLEEGSCPLLEVLWIDTIGGRVTETSAGYRALGPASVLPRQLKLTMINSDRRANSEFVVGRRRWRH